MSELNATIPPPAIPPPAGFRSELGHLAVRVDGLRPPEVPFLFERKPERMGRALVSSVGVHALLALTALLLTLYGPKPHPGPATPERANKDIVWLSVPGPGGGGGGGGNQMKEPPRKAELPGKEKITVPATKLPEVAPTPKPPDPPKAEQELTIPAKTLGDSLQTAIGAIEGTNPQATLSQGSGTAGGAGTGAGGGIGPGQGSGLGPGYGGGTGGGAYRPGNGVELPRVLREVRPNYTADAMRAKVQGTVWVEAVVLQDGTVGEAKIVRSLDSTFGLDEEALKAARQWRFAPGTRFGQPVPVLVTIELTFTLR
jgi:periplasmic protein TonB